MVTERPAKSPGAGASGGDGPRARRPWSRVELSVPVVYAVAAAAWIAFSDLLIAHGVRSVEVQAAWSIVKGFAFVALTAALLHVALRRGLHRERIAHARLQASEALLRNVTDSVPDPIFLKDRHGRWTFANPATLEAIGKRMDEVLGRTDREIYLDPAVGEAIMQVDRRIIASGAVEILEERIETPRGPRVFLSTKAPLRDGGGEVVGIVGNARDVTERKRAEEAVRRLEEQVQRAQKLESIGRLAGGVAHDFNNLLTVILSCAEALEAALASGAPADLEDVREIRAAGKRAGELTRQLLAFARKQVIAPVPLVLNELVHGTEKLLRRVLTEDVELDTVLQPALWPVRCDPGQIEQVILNLAVNARDAMPRGGRLTIETGNVDIAGEEALRTGGRCGPFVRLVVRDSGAGLAEEVKAHLFEPFFTTKPTGQGTGLGLATVYGIVEQADGHVRVESELGRGTTFEIYLPRSAEAPRAHVEAPAPAPRRGSETVLVVEDEKQVREVSVRALRAAGYQVLVAGGPYAALDLGDAALERVELLVTDVVMPGMDGRMLAEELRRNHPRLRVLYVSGYPREVIAERGVLEAGTELLAKPFTGAALLARVQTVLDASPAA